MLAAIMLAAMANPAWAAPNQPNTGKPSKPKQQTAPVMFRSNAHHTAYYKTKGVHKFHGVKWKFKSGGGISSAPAVVGGKVYFGNWGGKLFALDEKTGQ